MPGVSAPPRPARNTAAGTPSGRPAVRQVGGPQLTDSRPPSWPGRSRPVTLAVMTATSDQTRPVFEVRVQTPVAAPPEAVYAVVSDLPRSGEWSEECTGGRWVSGGPGRVGSVFRGVNVRPADVVGWAPVVRGEWTTESEVVEAAPGRRFAWAMRTKAGQAQPSVWAWEVEPDGAGGSLLTHHFRMDARTEGIRGIVAGMDPAAEQRFFTEWARKLEGDIAATVARVKSVIEAG